MNIFITIVRIGFSILLIFVGVLTIAFSSNSSMNQEMSIHSKMLYGFNAKMGKFFGKKYAMSMYGTGGGAKKDGIWQFSLSLERCGNPLTENEARRLIINCLDDFLEAANSDEELRPFLKTYPFKPESIDLAIFSSDKEGYTHYFLIFLWSKLQMVK
jgi:hypothetical protein